MTSIEWCRGDDGVEGKTWNPVTGCSKVSAGCKNCYAEAVARRFWKGRKFTDVQCHEDRLDEPLRWRKPRRVFVNSMSDLFHEDVPDAFIDRVFAVMALAPQHTFQVLTKRPERMRAYVSAEATPGRVARAADALLVAQACSALAEEQREIAGFPGYFVTNTGKVLSGKRGDLRELKPDAGEQGHMRVPLFRDGGPRRGERHLVHRLVLDAFVGPAPTTDAQGCHQDGNPVNNALPNLRWGDQSSNWNDRIRHGRARAYSKLEAGAAEEIRSLIASGHPAERVGRDYGISGTQARNIARGDQWANSGSIEWPLRSVWLGVSVEDQRAADERIPLLLQTPAAVRFLSCEPLLGPIDLCHLQPGDPPTEIDALNGTHGVLRPHRGEGPRVDWVIVGGESGPGARPCRVRWVRSIVEQCKTACVPVFLKQLGAQPVACDRWDMTEEQFEDLDASEEGWSEADGAVVLRLRNRKGGDPSEWPEDLRVRQFPEAGEVRP